MKQNYNETLEKEIHEIMKQFKGYGYDYSSLINQLQEGYNKTNYPGYLHRIGYLYENKIVKPTYEKQYLTYYSDAADMNYALSIIRLNEICLEEIDYKIDLNRKLASKLNHIDDPYATYILAKYYMMQSICINQNDEHYNLQNALHLMKNSAENGCQEAIQFMKTYEENNQ